MINFSQAANNNRAPILEQLTQQLAEPACVLEIGSGSGQHALFFAAHLPKVRWQPTDQGEYFEGLKENLRDAPDNVQPPRYLDLRSPEWPTDFDTLYSANVIHIAPPSILPRFFETTAHRVFFYGPFKYQGHYTSDSNRDFDQWLRDRNAESGIRDIETLIELGQQYDYVLSSDTPMPANNQFLVFRRKD